MKNFKLPVEDKLRLDVIEYAFVEWLICRGIFTAFQANYDRDPLTRGTLRDHLRNHILHACRTPSLGPEALITSAFLFHKTPEGYEFWDKHSDAWQRFYDTL